MLNNQPIENLNPHYTNLWYQHARTVWLAEGYELSGRDGTVNIPGVEYNYSDRIWQWDWGKADEARKHVDSRLDRRSPAFIQEFLRWYFDNPKLELVHVMAGFNLSNGYPYQVYGYKINE